VTSLIHLAWAAGGLIAAGTGLLYLAHRLNTPKGGKTRV
jgi:hypothetical protein